MQAALGAKVTVETLDGSEEIEFEPGTQPGEVRVLRGKGMPVLQGFGRGDQRVLVNVSVPHRLSAEQRRHLEEFEQLSDEHTYKPDQGFFDKLRDIKNALRLAPCRPASSVSPRFSPWRARLRARKGSEEDQRIAGCARAPFRF